jgi:hypothetical protein
MSLAYCALMGSIWLCETIFVLVSSIRCGSRCCCLGNCFDCTEVENTASLFVLHNRAEAGDYTIERNVETEDREEEEQLLNEDE